MNYLKLLIISILLCQPLLVTASERFTSIDSTEYPKQITINGVNLIAYTLEQDDKILKCVIQEKALLKKADDCDHFVDSLEILNEELYTVNELYSLENHKLRKLYYQADNKITLLDKKNILLLENQLMIEEQIKVIKTENKKVKRRNKTILIISGIIVTGLVTGLIIK